MKRRKSKLYSSTLWFSIWSALYLTYALITKIDVSWFSGVSVALAGIIVAYVAGNKAIDYKVGPEMIDTDGDGIPDCQEK